LSSEIEHNSFDLIELKQSVFHGVRIDGEEFTPLAWSAFFQRRMQQREL